MPPRNGNGWERWRGEISAHLEHLSELPAQLKELGDRFERALTDHAALDATFMRETTKALAQLNTKHARLAGKAAVVAALVGAVFAVTADAAIRHFFG